MTSTHSTGPAPETRPLTTRQAVAELRRAWLAAPDGSAERERIEALGKAAKLIDDVFSGRLVVPSADGDQADAQLQLGAA